MPISLRDLWSGDDMKFPGAQSYEDSLRRCRAWLVSLYATGKRSSSIGKQLKEVRKQLDALDR